MKPRSSFRTIVNSINGYMTEVLVAEIDVPLSVFPLCVLTLVIKYDRRSIILDTLILVWSCLMWAILVT